MNGPKRKPTPEPPASIILGCITNASDLIWKRLRREAPAMLKDRKRQRRGFETRLVRKWGRALDLLEMVREIAVEAGDDFNTEFRPRQRRPRTLSSRCSPVSMRELVKLPLR